MRKFICFFIAFLLIANPVFAARKHGEYAKPKQKGFIKEGGKTYVDLNKDEKRQLKSMKFRRQQCFYAHIREIDDGESEPQKIANSVAGKCKEHQEKIQKHMLETMIMNKDFVHDYMRTMKEEALASLVPYVLKYRGEQRKIYRGF